MKAHNNQEIGNKMNNSKRKIKNSKNKTVKILAIISSVLFNSF